MHLVARGVVFCPNLLTFVGIIVALDTHSDQAIIFNLQIGIEVHAAPRTTTVPA